MGVVKLNKKKVELIKHLRHNKGWEQETIAEFIGNVSRGHISKIDRNIRWSHIPCPDSERGQMLYYILLSQGELE
jgi:hypothetical protein